MSPESLMTFLDFDTTHIRSRVRSRLWMACIGWCLPIIASAAPAVEGLTTGSPTMILLAIGGILSGIIGLLVSVVKLLEAWIKRVEPYVGRSKRDSEEINHKFKELESQIQLGYGTLKGRNVELESRVTAQERKLGDIADGVALLLERTKAGA